MQYPIAIYHRHGEYHVVVPDIAALTITANTIAEAVAQMRHHIFHYLHQRLIDGLSLPTPTPVDEHLNHAQYAGVTWAIVNVDITRLTGATKELTVQLPAHLYVQLHDVFRDIPLDKVVVNALECYLTQASSTR